MDGQAETAPESGGLNDLVSFLSDTPEEESTEEIETNPADESTAESDTDEEANSEQDEEVLEEADEPAPVEKITFKVKGEDGTEETVEASTEELAASYLRQKDYTKKTQALAERESQAVSFLKTKHDEIRNQYLSQAEVTRAALVQMAGLKTGDEMAQLAHSDPAAWVAARAAQEAEAQRAQSLQQQFHQTWEVLAKEKIDKPALAKIYDGVSKSYGFTQEELGNVYDHRLVRMMRDAQAYQALKSQKADVTRKVTEAPQMPNRQTKKTTRLDSTLENKFKSGRAKLNDLAAYLR